MAEWDFQKLAKGLWSSMRDLEYFQSDEMGQQVAKAAEAFIKPPPPTDPASTSSTPPPNGPIAIDIEAQDISFPLTAADETAFRELEMTDLFATQEATTDRDRPSDSAVPTPQPTAGVNGVKAPASPKVRDPQGTAPDYTQPNRRNHHPPQRRSETKSVTLTDSKGFKPVPSAHPPPKTPLATLVDSEPATNGQAPSAEVTTLSDPFGDDLFLSLDDLSLTELQDFDDLFTTPPQEPTATPTPSTPEVDSPTQPEGYQYFVTEAQDLLQTIEQELMALSPQATTAEIYSLMRATHTLKGAAANVRQETIKAIAHNLEDAFRAMLAPEAAIDAELQALLYEDYELLRLAVCQELTSEPIETANLHHRAADIANRLRLKLGDCFEHQPPLPSSSEMGFDLTQSIFEVGVQERLDELSQILTAEATPARVQAAWESQADVLIGLAESLVLPGFQAIVVAGNDAIAQHPDHILAIAPILLANLQVAQQQILAGDRTSGGTVSPALQQWLDSFTPPTTEKPSSAPEQQPEITPIPSQVTLASDLWSKPDRPEGKLSEAHAMPLTFPDDVDAIVPEVEPEGDKTQSLASTKAQPKTLRIELEQLEYLNHLVGELLINQNQLMLRDGQFQDAVQKLADWIRQHRRTLFKLRDTLPRGSNRSNTQPTPAQRLLFAAIEETSQISQASEDLNLLVRTTAATLEREHRLSKQLRDNMEAARMMPLAALLKRFPPMVKQLAFIHKKPVALQLKGTEVLIDKTVTENLYDALLHLVRNAFDHGIEPAEERRLASKPTTGSITITAFNQGNRTIIEIEDDGQGLDVQRICQRAVDRDLLTPAEAQRLVHSGQPDARLLQLLCEPGFSTTTQVSDLSGRGVGLDVVKTQLQPMKGVLQVRSQPGGGTCFIIQIREALLNARLVICRAGHSVYGFVANEIEQVLIPGEQLRWIAGQKVLDWNQDNAECTIPVYELAGLFSLSARLTQTTAYQALNEQGELEPVLTTTAGVHPIMLLRTPDGLIGLEVNQILEEQELVIKPISAAVTPPPYVYGCSILADGRLILVLDGAMLVQQTQLKGMRVIQEAVEMSPLAPKRLTPQPLSTPALGLYIPAIATEAEETPPPEPSRASSQKTVVVVDDSLTERQTLTLMLQRAQHHAIALKDGREALDYLQVKGAAVDVILCDIEMPKLNGLELLHIMRQDHQLQNIPIAMLTSRSRDKFQTLTLELGAYAYLTKPYVESEILAIIEQGIHLRRRV